MTGSAGQRRVPRAFLENLEIPLPPLDEQRRIAAILDQADALRLKRREASSLLDRLPSQLFRASFGDLIENDRNWPVGKISDLVKGFESGKSLVSADEDDADSLYKILKISAVTSLKFRSKEFKSLPEFYIPPTNHLVRLGDLLFSRANTAELIGATAYVDQPCDRLALPDKLWRFCWYPDDRTSPLFVWQLFMELPFRAQIRRRATGTSGSMKNIGQDKVLGIEIGIPPASLQKNFSEKFAALRELATVANRQALAFENLFASLQHRAFNGELTNRAAERELSKAV